MDIEITCNTDDEAIFANVRENAHNVRRWLCQTEAHDGHAVIVGGGPSLAEHLPSIQKRLEHGQTIFALNGTAGFLNENGIIPNYQVLLDARPEMAGMLAAAHKYLIASQCDPSVLDMLDDDAILWHPAMEGLVTHLPEHNDPYVLIGGGTTVGLSAMCLAYAMGFRTMHLYGYDSSHRETKGHAYSQTMNDGDIMCKVTLGGKTFASSLAMARQAELFPEVCNNLLDLGCVITMDADGLIMEVMNQMRLHAVQPMTEAAKYRAMWEQPAYREFSPGENFADEFVKIAHISTLNSVIDFGCGSGRGGKRIRDLTGCWVTQVDFAENCRDADNTLPFEVVDLTEEITGLKADFGYCTDVMEHIPTEDVPAVIKNIMSCVDSCFFKIALFPDSMGALIGHPLHLSVFPMEWWEDHFADYRIDYRQCDRATPFPYATFFIQKMASRKDTQ